MILCSDYLMFVSLQMASPQSPKAVIGQTVHVCGSLMVEQASKYYQSQGDPLYHQESHLFQEPLLS